MTTLKDVAKKAGVSPSLVSYVLNGQKKVRPETYDRIQNAIQELDYRPNLLAGALKTNRSMTIGVIAYDMENAFVWDVLAGIEDELRRNQYCAIICNSQNNWEIEEAYLNQLSARAIDGLILISTGEKVHDSYYDFNIPLVCVDRNFDQSLCSVTTDNEEGGYIGGEYLISKGLRRILFIGNFQMGFCQKRFDGFNYAMEEHGLKDQILKCNVDGFQMDLAYGAMENLLKSGTKFDAVFASTDTFAIGALKALYDNNVKVPKQVAVLGYDDIMQAKFSIPALSTVSQPKTQMGHCAVHQLLAMIENEPLQERHICLKPEIIEREST